MPLATDFEDNLENGIRISEFASTGNYLYNKQYFPFIYNWGHCIMDKNKKYRHDLDINRISYEIEKDSDKNPRKYDDVNIYDKKYINDLYNNNYQPKK